MIRALPLGWLTLAGLWSLSALAAGPSPIFPRYDSPAALTAACDRGLDDMRRQVLALERRAAGPGWLAAYDRLNAAIEDVANRPQFLSVVHPDPAIRAAAEACELRWNDFSSSLGQNQRLYQAARAVRPADAIDAALRERLLEEFEDAGVALPAAQRPRAKALSDRIAALGQAFERNIRDANTRVAFTEPELAGVPDSAWRQAPRDAEGRVLLGLDASQYLPVIQMADSAAARERMWRAKTDEGGPANLALLAEISQLRREYAALFGQRSWAEFQLRRRMAGEPARAERFLADVREAVSARQARELEELRVAKAQHLGVPLAETRLARWDQAYYTERVRRERYQVDQEAFRPYFPPQPSLQFALRVVERLMGVRYRRLDAAEAGPLWHDEVQAYAVSDAASGRRLATLLVDLYPRDGKYNHAAVWGLQSSSRLQNRRSLAVLVVNFNREGLSLEELETLLHELGHAVHHNLSGTRYSAQAGTQVRRDFVEAPSQMLEDWVYDPKVLALFAEVCPACRPVPAAMLAQADTARHYAQGAFHARQALYAGYDLALYGREPQEPMALWARMEGATPLGHVPGTMFPAGFAHIATNYSAGYYGYLWSLVVATDLRTAFDGHRLDAAVGRRYRERVLAQGGQRPPQALVRDFLGRDFNAQAFFAELQR